MEQGTTTRVGLMGWPVRHSLSAVMHQAAFDALGLDWAYLLLPVAPERLGDGTRGLRGLGFVGANVTVPHKEAVMRHLDEVTMEARAIGAVNTIVVREGRMVGTNTDALGFLRGLREAGVEPRGARAVVLGAGGAARAVLYALLAAGAQVTLVNRTSARAAALARRFEGLFQAKIRLLGPGSAGGLTQALGQATLLVNTTPVGMTPHVDRSPLPAGVRLGSHLAVNDLVYNPRRTRLLDAARVAGATPIDGLGMLLHQGAAAFSLWTGRPAPLDIMRAALDAASRER